MKTYQRLIEMIDAPNLIKDYYANVLSWSSWNILASALGLEIFLLKFTENYEINKSKILKFKVMKEEAD